MFLLALLAPASPAPPRYVVFLVGVSALHLPWLTRDTYPAFTGIRPTKYTPLGFLFNVRVPCLFSDLMFIALLVSHDRISVVLSRLLPSYSWTISVGLFFL